MLVLSLVLVLLGGVAFAQQPAQLNFRHFRVEDGLSQGSINAILQDHKGFIWIGTHDGLNRFDGVEFKVFRHRPDDSHSLSSSWIQFLIEDSSGVLWVGTEKGLDRFDRATESFELFSQGPRFASVIPFYEGGTVKFWMAGTPVKLFDPLKKEIRDLDIRRRDGSILDLPAHLLAKDKQGHLWAVGTSTLSKIDPRSQVVEDLYDIGTRSVLTIVPSRYRSGEVWLGCATELLCLRNGRLVSIGKFPVTSLTEDTEGYLWIGTQEGLARLDLRDSTADTIIRFHHDPVVTTSLSHNVVTQVFQDASGSLWVGTYNGLNLFDRYSPPFSIYRTSPNNPKSLGNNFVMPIVEDRAGNIWFGTLGSGVSVLQRTGPRVGTFIHFRHDPRNPNSLQSDNIRSMLCGKDGKILIGSTLGLNIYDPETGAMASWPSADMSGVPVEAMCESRDGSIWIPFNNSLMRLDRKNRTGNNVRRFPIPGGREYVFIHEDSEGIIWLATVGAGLIRFDPHTETFKQYEHDPKNPASLSSNNVWTIFEDTKDTSGTLWIGTSQGLNKLNTKTGTCTRHLEQEGFPNAWVYGILQDDLQRLWLSTNQGLVVFDDRQPEGRAFRNFTHADGIAGDEFNRRSFCRLRNGELLFGGPNGVTRFHPGSVRDDPTVPPLVLTAFSKLGSKVVFDRDVADVSSIELNHDENVFSFEFAALNYASASKTRYAYMMEGVDNDWVPAGTRRSVNYAYLLPGSYVFRVKASHTSGVWNDNHIAIQMRIHPPFWATWWFIALCVCAIAGSVVIVFRARVRRLLEIEGMRTRIARDLHDEIGSNLSSIAMASDLLGRQSGIGDRERGKLSEISSVALSTVKDMKDIVWLIRPGNDSLDDLLLRMKDTAGALLEGCNCTLNFPADTNDKKVNLEWKRNLYLIYKETLTNILRHARATSVTIDVRIVEDRLVLQVEDNGTGFDPDTVRSGNGLRNIRERAELLHATIDIKAHPGTGTTVRLETRIT